MTRNREEELLCWPSSRVTPVESPTYTERCELASRRDGMEAHTHAPTQIRLSSSTSILTMLRCSGLSIEQEIAGVVHFGWKIYLLSSRISRLHVAFSPLMLCFLSIILVCIVILRFDLSRERGNVWRERTGHDRRLLKNTFQ